MRLITVSVLVFAGCASSSGGPLQGPVQRPTRFEPTVSGYDIVLDHPDHPVGQSFAAPADRIWPLALAAYTAVGLRLDRTDPVRHIAQTRAQVLRRQLNGRSLSTYFDCGNDITGKIADNWRIKLDARMAVAPAASPDSSGVQTMLTITAAPVEGTSTEVTPCSSKGSLESEIAQHIGDALAQQPLH